MTLRAGEARGAARTCGQVVQRPQRLPLHRRRRVRRAGQHRWQRPGQRVAQLHWPQHAHQRGQLLRRARALEHVRPCAPGERSKSTAAAGRCRPGGSAAPQGAWPACCCNPAAGCHHQLYLLHMRRNVSGPEGPHLARAPRARRPRAPRAAGRARGAGGARPPAAALPPCGAPPRAPLSPALR